jgi:hypothetical protein
MFASACKRAGAYTHPVIIRRRFFDGTVRCSCGAFIVLNEDGWIVTAAHLWNAYFKYQEHAVEILDYERRVEAIRQDPALDYEQKSRRIGLLRTDPGWITHVSYWWGREGVRLKDMKFLPDGDLVIGRLDPFDPGAQAAYPVIKDPSSLDVGTSLCRLGYPFSRIEATFDQATQSFEFSPGSVHPARFPVEGIYTRELAAGPSRDGRYEIKFVETSSPGILGQSGGPIFDARSSLWGVQSRTDMYPMGPAGRNEKGGADDGEPPYFSVGVGVHPALLVTFLKDHDVRFSLSDY